MPEFLATVGDYVFSADLGSKDGDCRMMSRRNPDGSLTVLTVIYDPPKGGDNVCA